MSNDINSGLGFMMNLGNDDTLIIFFSDDMSSVVRTMTVGRNFLPSGELRTAIFQIRDHGDNDVEISHSTIATSYFTGTPDELAQGIAELRDLAARIYRDEEGIEFPSMFHEIVELSQDALNKWHGYRHMRELGKDAAWLAELHLGDLQ